MTAFDEGYSSYLEVTYSQNLLYKAELERTEGAKDSFAGVRESLQGDGGWRMTEEKAASGTSGKGRAVGLGRQ